MHRRVVGKRFDRRLLKDLANYVLELLENWQIPCSLEDHIHHLDLLTLEGSSIIQDMHFFHYSLWWS